MVGTEWHRMPRGGGDPKVTSEELGTWWPQQGWGLWGGTGGGRGDRAWGGTRDGKGDRAWGGTGGGKGDSGDMGAFLRGCGEDTVTLEVAEGPWGCP